VSAPVLVHTEQSAAYDFGRSHPLRPERVTLTIDLMRAYGLIAESSPAEDEPGFRVVAPYPAREDQLMRVHSREYVSVVKAASERPETFWARKGLGEGDTPVFAGMHDAAALIAGGSIAAIREVLAGRALRAFHPAGGLHHAHRDHAAGFCVYNDAAAGIAWALTRGADLRIAYIDIDAHHGDGVQEAFYAEPRVLTISVHESGRYLFPGTGWPDERGEGAGAGSAMNVPLPPNATDACYRLVFDDVIAPAVRAFAPHVIVSQNGADAHWSDPLTTLGMTIAGHAWLTHRIRALADEVSGGRLVALGGGGYAWATVVPRAWTLTAASLLGVRLPEELPSAWRDLVSSYVADAPYGLLDDAGPRLAEGEEARLLEQTRLSIARTLAGGSGG